MIINIHGGGFLYGAGSKYGPKYLLDRDVILVTFNYRLGPLGKIIQLPSSIQISPNLGNTHNTHLLNSIYLYKKTHKICQQVKRTVLKITAVWDGLVIITNVSEVVVAEFSDYKSKLSDNGNVCIHDWLPLLTCVGLAFSLVSALNYTYTLPLCYTCSEVRLQTAFITRPRTIGVGE